jgi:hypothetical protein
VRPRAARVHRAGEALGEAALVVDCDITGAAATYGHWLGAPPPPSEIASDTATGVLLAAARDPARWLDRWAAVWIDHLDADGLIAATLACAPALARHGELLLGAAESGDFAAWSTERAFRAMLVLHQALARAGRDVDAQARLLAGAATLLAELPSLADAPDPRRDAACAQVRDAIRRLARGDGVAVTRGERLALIAWTARAGHPADGYLAVDAPDDLPPCALSAALPPLAHQLLAMRDSAGWTYLLDAPRHSWAATVARPRVAWRDFAALAATLEAGERQHGSNARWVARPQASRVGFLCQLASVDADLRPRASRLDPELVAAAVEAELAQPVRQR